MPSCSSRLSRSRPRSSSSSTICAARSLRSTQTRNANLRDLNQAETDLAKARRQYDLQKPLAERGFVSMKTFNDTKDDLNYQTSALRS